MKILIATVSDDIRENNLKDLFPDAECITKFIMQGNILL